MNIKACETCCFTERSPGRRYVLELLTVAVYPTYCSFIHAASPFLRQNLNKVVTSTPQAPTLHIHDALIALIASFLSMLGLHIEVRKRQC